MIALYFVMALSSLAAAEPLETRLTRVVESFYDLRFPEALAGVESIERDFPGNPAGPFFRGLIYYQRALVEDPPSAETLKKFDDQNLKTLEACESYESKDPALAAQYMGAAIGFRSRALFAQKNYPLAILQVRKAIKHLKRAVKLNPDLEDAYLGLGLYHYFLSRIPAAFKPFAFLMVGMKGDRELGLQQLQRAAERGGPSRMEARAVLAAIYGSRWERRWDESETLYTELMTRYPRNPRFRLRRAYLAVRRGDWDKTAQLIDPKGAWLEALDPAIRARARQEAEFRFKEAGEIKAGKRKQPRRFRWPLTTEPEN